MALKNGLLVVEDDTESEALAIVECEHARLVFAKNERPRKHKVIIKGEESQAAPTGQSVSLLVRSPACEASRGRDAPL